MVPTVTERARTLAASQRLRGTKWLAAALWAGLMCLPLAHAQGNLPQVFACEPEWAALTRMLLPGATVTSATHAGQDPHHIEARPSLIARLRSADLAVCTGAGLEDGWLPVLLQRAGNARVADVWWASDQVELIDPQPGAIGTPWAGDVHAQGNPHIHTHPGNLLDVAAALAQRLQQLAPQQARAIDERHRLWAAAWRDRMAQWQQRAAPLRGQAVVAQHTSFGYLWRWLGMRVLADLEPRPGMAPTPGHLQRLRDGLRAQPPLAVVVSSYQDPRAARWLVEQLATPPQARRVSLLVLPATVDDTADGAALVRWMDSLVEALVQAKAAADATP